MLRIVAEQLRSKVRGSDVVARVGGDEFAIVLTDCPTDVGTNTAEMIISAVEGAQLTTTNGEFRVGISVGMTHFGAGGRTRDLDGILREADRAAYQAKRSGAGLPVLSPAG